jgi:hypothetical protein
MNLMGALAGLALGLGVAALLEYRDTSLRTDDDVVSSIGLPVLAMIPMMASTADERRRLRNRWIMVATAAVAMISCTQQSCGRWRRTSARQRCTSATTDSGNGPSI